MSYPQMTKCIRGAIRRNGLTDTTFAKEMGMSYNTLQLRWRDPGSWRLFEWGTMKRHISFLPDEEKLLEKEIASL
jgi:hypothetical protein